jgi:hypothetical protein
LIGINVSMLPPSRSVRLITSGPNIKITPGRETAAASLRFWQLVPAALLAHLPVFAVPTHCRGTSRPQVSNRCPVDRLRAQQRLLQLHRTGINLNLQLRLRTEHNARVPISIGAAAHQQQTAGVQANHSSSP